MTITITIIKNHTNAKASHIPAHPKRLGIRVVRSCVNAAQYLTMHQIAMAAKLYSDISVQLTNFKWSADRSWLENPPQTFMQDR